MGTLSGKTALITGASRGIGEAIVRLFAERGWSVIFTFVSNSAAAHKVATEAGARAIRCDSGDEDDILTLFDALDGEGIALDALVNNAGGSPPRPALDTSDSMFARSFDFNVTTAFSLTRLAVPHMLAGDGGSVVNISSAAGRLAQPGFAAYGTAKAALSALTRLLGQEFAPRVRVNAIRI